MAAQNVRSAVREHYASVAREQSACCGPTKAAGGCCGAAPAPVEISRAIGYSEQDLSAVPAGANLGLGCGNPLLSRHQIRLLGRGRV